MAMSSLTLGQRTMPMAGGGLGRDKDSNQLIIRRMDVVIAAAGLVLFLPLMLVVAMILAIDGGPILFAHGRVGYGGKRFYCLKFRTMVVGAEKRLTCILGDDSAARFEWERSHKLRIDPRVTRFGRFLRRSSLDELPQLLNVLRGEMSIVGPRPIVEAEIVHYRWRIANYCSVKPGLTGIWQVSGRNDVEYRRRVAMDCLYAKSCCPSLYLWLVVATIPAVLGGRASY
jgi:lipopolysaccharide/colanic/teichoic acid biosynthesis glycosyltransferase